MAVAPELLADGYRPQKGGWGVNLSRTRQSEDKLQTIQSFFENFGQYTWSSNDLFFLKVNFAILCSCLIRRFLVRRTQGRFGQKSSSFLEEYEEKQRRQILKANKNSKLVGGIYWRSIYVFVVYGGAAFRVRSG